MKKIIILGVVVVLLIIGIYFIFQNLSGSTTAENQQQNTPVVPVTQVEEENEEIDEVTELVDDTKTVIGTSAGGNPITAYHYGEGDTELLFVGGIHGGYSWNTVLLAYELMDELQDNTRFIPDDVRVTVIPVMNPDGLQAVVGTTSRFVASAVPASAATIVGRFNDNTVDLNRNFDCDWQEEGVWQSRKVSGGDSAFSEPEAQAVRDYVDEHTPNAVVVWYSAAGGVFASNCHGEVLAETSALTNLYAQAAGYRAFEEFNFYEITGDMVNWLAKQGVPAISVLLTNHTAVEWDKNKAGIAALLQYYAD